MPKQMGWEAGWGGKECEPSTGIMYAHVASVRYCAIAGRIEVMEQSTPEHGAQRGEGKVPAIVCVCSCSKGSREKNVVSGMDTTSAAESQHTVFYERVFENSTKGFKLVRLICTIIIIHRGAVCFLKKE